MKHYFYILLFSVFLIACKTIPTEEETSIAPKSPVQISSIRIGEIDDNLLLSATTIYLNRNVITAEIPAFITKVNIHLGDKIIKGQVLYELQTKESKALGKQSFNIDTSITNIGIIKNGII